MGDIVSREQLSRQGMKGIGGVAGGLALVLVGGAVGSVLGSMIIGGLVGLVGLAMLTSKGNRKAGVLAIVIAGVTFLALRVPAIAHLARFLLLVPGIGLIGFGAWSLVKFFKNLKARS
jgi:hypothetical protein